MLGLDYNERVAHEMNNIPVSYYYVDQKHPAYHAPLHWHRPSEIVRVLSGKLKMYLDGKKILVEPGDILFINQEIIHGFFPLNCVYEIINFDADEILLRTSLCKDALRIFTNSHVSVLPFHPTEDAAIHHIATQLFTFAATETKDHDLLVLGALFELLGTIYAKHHYTENYKSSTNAKLFKPLLEFIEKSYMKPITLLDMAQVSGMSTSHFSVLFREFFRQTPMDYLNSYRIERACLFLINSELPVTEVAYRCGFNDSAYDISYFKTSSDVLGSIEKTIAERISTLNAYKKNNELGKIDLDFSAIDENIKKTP